MLCGSRQECTCRKTLRFVGDRKLQAEGAMRFQAGVWENLVVRSRRKAPGRGCYAVPGRSIGKLSGSFKMESSRQRVYVAPGWSVQKLSGSYEIEGSRQRMLCGSRLECMKTQRFVLDGKLQVEGVMPLQAGV